MRAGHRVRGRPGRGAAGTAPGAQAGRRHGGNYFDVPVISETWRKGWHVRYWLAPLQVTCEEIATAGFVIERLLEPRPAPEAAAIDPEDYERLCREPRGFIAFRLRPAR